MLLNEPNDKAIEWPSSDIPNEKGGHFAPPGLVLKPDQPLAPTRRAVAAPEDGPGRKRGSGPHCSPWRSRPTSGEAVTSSSPPAPPVPRRGGRWAPGTASS